MSAAPKNSSRNGWRGTSLVLASMLAGCSNDADSDRHWTITGTEPAIRAQLAALAQCQSPLVRLRIPRPPLRVDAGMPGRLTIAASASTAQRTSTLRFDLTEVKDRTPRTVRLTWNFELASAAQELDLGIGRLINPPLIAKALTSAVNGYIDTLVEAPTPDQRRARDRSCRKIGRLLDAVAATTDPNLRRMLERQKRRDALGWLIQDDYQLRTDSPTGADWESEADYRVGVD